MSALRTRTVAALLAPGVLIATVLIAAPATAANTLTVCGSGCDYTTINDAVTAASAGDTISVQGGTYAESVGVAKSLTIEGTPGTTVIPGPGYTDAGFTLEADDITIEGFTIGNRDAISQTIGIDAGGSSGAVIHNDIIVNNQRGLSLAGASNVTVSDSRFSDNNGSGPNNNAALWGDNVSGISITGSTFTGHTNTAINLATSSDITIDSSHFDDNGNVAVIWGDHHATVSNNTGTLMGGSGVYVTDSSDVTISGNDLAADGGTNGISISSAAGPSSSVAVTDNVVRDFVQGVSIGSGALSDSLVATGNQFLTATVGVHNLGSTQVDARGNWWGDASGPADPNAGDGSVPDTNAGTGVAAEGAVDYSDWCVNAACQTPVPPTTPAVTKLQVKVLALRHGNRVLKIRVSAGTTSVDGDSILVRKANGRRVLLVQVHHHGRASANLGRLNTGTHVYTVIFAKTATAGRASKKITIHMP